MKDSYSFDTTDEGLDASYAAHREAYIRTFDRFGFDYVIVKATAGAMGGSKSEEFLAPAEAGEDTFADCPNCDFAANTEAITFELKPVDADGVPALEEIPTPDTPTIETLAAHLGVPASATLKNLLVKVDGEIVAVGVPGDREVDMKRLEAALEPAEVALLEEADFAARPFLVKGYIGPGALAANGVRFLVDPRIVTGTAWVTGADKPDHHVVDLVVGRDFTPDGTIEAAEVRAGDPSPDGQGVLEAARGIEIGHIFQLGRKYADAFSLDALGPDSKPVRITMGSYGIGVSRLVAAIAEQSHDEHGLVWPRSVTPFDVHLVVAGKQAEIREGAEKLAEQLDAAGLRVLLDDRTASPGVKFADAELVGVPTIVVVGRGLASGVIEVKDRKTGERTEVAVASAVEHLVELTGKR
jgi:prolyl-tRNA synthetase